MIKNLIKMTSTILLFSMSSIVLFGQSKSQNKTWPIKVWVKPMDKTFKYQGYISEIGDSLKLISDLNNYQVRSIDFKNIKEVEVDKRRGVIKGILIGAVVGAAVGGMLGYAQGDDPPPDHFLDFSYSASEKAALGALLFPIPGAIIGGIVGAAKIKIPINGNRNNEKERLKKYQWVF